MDVVFIFPVPLISSAILMLSARVDKKIKNEFDSLTDGNTWFVIQRCYAHDVFFFHFTHFGTSASNN